jgi:ferritin-like protein
MDGPRAGRLSRRELIAGTLAAGGATALVASDPASAAPVTDASLLTAALTAEQLAVMAYERVLTLTVFTDPQLALLRGLLAHERAHVQVLKRELTALGAALPPAPTSDSDVDAALSAHGMSGNLAGLSTAKAALQLLLDVGALCEGAYYMAVEKLSVSGPLVRAIQALASEAQHATLLAEQLYGGDVTKAVPNWYVAGVR